MYLPFMNKDVLKGNVVKAISGGPSQSPPNVLIESEKSPRLSHSREIQRGALRGSRKKTEFLEPVKGNG